MNSIINLSGQLVNLQSPRVMAIINITPNSFYSHSCVKSSEVLSKVTNAIEQGADIIDIGADSITTFGLKKDGTVVAVGDNDYGQCNVGHWSNIIEVFI